jgi:siderophore synthetase component
MILPMALNDTSLKLGVGIKLTSAVRTISPASAYLGPRFSSQVVPALTMDHAILTVAKELASVVYLHPDGEIAKHCAAIVRECHENASEARNERLIVCTSLVEHGHDGSEPGVPSVIRVFGLDTEEKRLEWFETYVVVNTVTQVSLFFFL